MTFIRHRVRHRATIGMIVAALCAACPALSQPAHNIAGHYRGQLTNCISAPEPPVCRKDLAEIVRLAVEVDTRRVEWEKARTGSNSALTTSTLTAYGTATEKLDKAVADFYMVAGKPRG